MPSGLLPDPNRPGVSEFLFLITTVFLCTLWLPHLQAVISYHCSRIHYCRLKGRVTMPLGCPIPGEGVTSRLYFPRTPGCGEHVPSPLTKSCMHLYLRHREQGLQGPSERHHLCVLPGPAEGIPEPALCVQQLLLMHPLCWVDKSRGFHSWRSAANNLHQSLRNKPALPKSQKSVARGLPCPLQCGCLRGQHFPKTSFRGPQTF